MARRKSTNRKKEQPAETVFGPTLAIVAIANIFWFASLPPLNLSLLAWLVPACWVYLIRPQRLPGPRPYGVIWGVSALAWGVLLEGVGRAFWANYIGLVVLGSYLAVYHVLFVWLTRSAVHRWRVPIIIAAPVIWTGLELARAHLVTGFGVAMLGHTQLRVSWLIQSADLFGAYGLSFLMMFVGVCAVHPVLQRERSVRNWLPVGAAAILLVAAYGYGQHRLQQPESSRSPVRVALIQGTEDTVFHSSIEAAQRASVDTFGQYWRLTRDACERHSDLALIVWPESVFSGGLPEMHAIGDVTPPREADLTAEEFHEWIEERVQAFDQKTRAAAQTFDDANGGGRETYLLAGTDSVNWVGDRAFTYNSALLIAPSGAVAGRYHKMQRVLLGEYVPLGDSFPWLYNLLPIGRGLTAGNSPVSFTVRDVRMSPNICFEITLPHLIRRQFVALQKQNATPGVIVNLSNDGWFWGSAILDLQMTCAVFRAVELRRPVLVAANTGLTVWIDDNGVIRETLPRRKEGVIVADVQPGDRTSLYQWLGDAAAWACLAACLALLLDLPLCRLWRRTRE